MTIDGEKILRLELERLKIEERPRIVQAISEAREQGDLRENAEYQYAKEEQGFIEGRILDIEAKARERKRYRRKADSFDWKSHIWIHGYTAKF